MDLSKSILSAQYNNVATSPMNLADIRGTGKFKTSYPLSSNWPQANFQPNTSTYVQNARKEDVKRIESQNSNWDLSNVAPVATRRNDRFEYPQTLNHTLVGDPYHAYGLHANHEVPTALNTLFFNRTNVQYLQNRILNEVKNITGIQVKPQSENQLLIIMNNKYQYAQSGALPSSTVHLALPRGEKECSLRKRLYRINQAVIQECVKQILSGMNMYVTYYKDASSLPLPLSLPTYVSAKGGRMLQENIGLTSGNSAGLSSFNLRNTVVN